MCWRIFAIALDAYVAASHIWRALFRRSYRTQAPRLTPSHRFTVSDLAQSAAQRQVGSQTNWDVLVTCARAAERGHSATSGRRLRTDCLRHRTTSPGLSTQGRLSVGTKAACRVNRAGAQPAQAVEARCSREPEEWRTLFGKDAKIFQEAIGTFVCASKRLLTRGKSPTSGMCRDIEARRLL
jgi:hypothetical protein